MSDRAPVHRCSSYYVPALSTTTEGKEAMNESHWLLFNKDRHVVGCGCGFRADVEDDGGHGDSVVKHLSADAWADGWNARACGEFYETNPHRDASDRIRAVADAWKRHAAGRNRE